MKQSPKLPMPALKTTAEPACEFITTSDDWQIAMYHYPPEESKGSKQFPILMVHGIASDHHIWDLQPGANNFARFLAEQGYEVFTIDLRGHGRSDGPGTGRGFNWSVDDYLLCDLPRAVQYVLEKSGAERLHWVGHSMGGFLGYYYQIRHSHRDIASLTTFASSLTYTFSTINLFRSYIDYFTFLPFLPVGWMWRLSGPLAHWPLPWFRFLWNPDNMRDTDCRAVANKMLGHIGVLEWNQLKTISTAEGMPRISGGNYYHTVYDPRLQVPVLSLAADKDAICPLDGVIWTNRKLNIKSKMKVFGIEYGNDISYGHIDLVVGVHAPVDVWPHAFEWIEAFDSKVD